MSLNVNRRVPYGGSIVLTVSGAETVVDGYNVFLLTKPVRLGNSGLKVSRLILGTMSYGTPEWSPWVLGEEEGIAQIKFACVSTFQIQGPRRKRAYMFLFLTAPPLSLFTLSLTRSLGLNSVQLRKWHPDLRHGQCESSQMKNKRRNRD
jgi:hypothetical protein